jgi:hypothetical protein
VIRSKVLGVYDKGKATVVETEQCLVEKESGYVYSRAVGSGFYVGQGGWGGPKGKQSFHLRPIVVARKVCIVDEELKLYEQVPKSPTSLLPLANPITHTHTKLPWKPHIFTA